MEKTYLVGGAVRDKLMGIVPKDYDYVVVGGSVEEMLKRGYQMVGKDFPVFLDPENGDEVALARTERKTGDGHTAFTVDTDGVTLEEDLQRRDLTINAIAYDHENGKYIDPFGGIEDIKNRVLRHIPGGAFGDDPLRVLRVARFYATLGFDIHWSTIKLMHEMVVDGMLEHLTGERIFKEIDKALNGRARLFVELIDSIGATEYVFHKDYRASANIMRLYEGDSSDYNLNLVGMFINADIEKLPFTIPNDKLKIINFVKKYRKFDYERESAHDIMNFIRDAKLQHMKPDELKNSPILDTFKKLADRVTARFNIDLVVEDVVKYQSVDVEAAIKKMPKGANIKQYIDYLYTEALT